MEPKPERNQKTLSSTETFQSGLSNPNLGFVSRTMLAELMDEDINVRRGAAQTLGDLGKSTEEIQSALIVALEDRDRLVRFAAAGALMRVGKDSEPVLRALLYLLTDSEEIQSALIVALVALLHDSQKAVNTFRELLAQESEEVRFSDSHFSDLLAAW